MSHIEVPNYDILFLSLNEFCDKHCQHEKAGTRTSLDFQYYFRSETGLTVEYTVIHFPVEYTSYPYPVFHIPYETISFTIRPTISILFMSYRSGASKYIRDLIDACGKTESFISN